jgi:hypothetical protein
MRSRWNRHSAAAANHARAVHAPVVAHAITSGGRLVGDMGVPAGHALVDFSRSLHERHMVRPYEAVARVSDLSASSEVDPHGSKRIGSPFGRATHHREIDTAECRSAMSVTRRRPGDASKGQIELWMSPVLGRPGHVRDVQRHVVDRARSRPQVLDDSVPQRGLGGKNGLEASSFLTRGRQNGERDAVERKHALAATAWLDLVRDRLDHQMDDLQRFARAGSDGIAGGAIKSAGDREFQSSSFSKKIHGVHFNTSPLCAAAVTISPATGAALVPPYPAFSMMMAKAIRLVAVP